MEAKTKETALKAVTKTLAKGRFFVDSREDGIYLRLAGNSDQGEAFSGGFVNVFPFENYQDKLAINRCFELEELLSKSKKDVSAISERVIELEEALAGMANYFERNYSVPSNYPCYKKAKSVLSKPLKP